MNFFALVLLLVFCGTKLHSMPISSEGNHYVRSIGASRAALEGQGLNDDDRDLLYTILFYGAIAVGIVSCCACCPCCPLYKKMCCAPPARPAALAATPAAAPTPVAAAAVKRSTDETGTSDGTMDEIAQ
jgi:hypothetical protein